MKNLYSILLTALCLCGHAQSEDRLIPKGILTFPNDYLDVETLIFNQEEIENRYLEAKN